ncbi:MAG: MGMT family protein [Clostridiales bacterium]|jgi:methylated-DNA-protein-cysteine methyltransferase-like protein|nr:MGMT family protein [Clostridiales bacterium]
MTAFETIYDAVRKIPRGKVATYGQIALMAGNSRWARVVGYALHCNPDPKTIPCHRVLNRFGCVCEGFAFGGAGVQRQLLENEGVSFCADGRVDLSVYGYGANA